VARLLTARARVWLLAALALALLLHALALALLQYALQPPSLLRPMAEPLYTRAITPQAPAPVAAPAPAAAAVGAAAHHRPSARVRPARPAVKKRTPPASAPPAAVAAAAAAASAAPPITPPQAAAPEPPASIALAEPPAPPPLEPASQPAPALAAASAPASEPASEPASAAEPALAAASQPASAASAPEPQFLAGWPRDTRLTYTLGGNYRGELHGSAHVLWQREGARYQAIVEMSAGLLASLTLSSQGQITPAGLRPQVYEEATRKRRRGVRLDEQDVLLKNGQRVPRPESVQDTASQFVELAHRFASGQTPLAAGGQIRVTLARPGGIEDWIYDVQAQETLYLPRLGPVAAWHLKPRRLNTPGAPGNPGNGLSAELWFAPSLQYLPVRIRIAQDEDTYMDLLTETIEQQ
jgi:hypothetical protein